MNNGLKNISVNEHVIEWLTTWTQDVRNYIYIFIYMCVVDLLWYASVHVKLQFMICCN